ncbi:MAG: long-chain fatty acid--CoA ligase [Pseudomonadota bacterium]|jgi:long-chain acyl-CoA synthetase|nr:long-chain fatty acid--CoA ligase [Pseudomonadota bacterium]HPX19363.1 long-chain fatty acid--CoA ligase [Deltaproteobacteria bacterium]
MSFQRVWHKHYNPDVPAELAFDRTTLSEMLSRSAQNFPDVTALIYMGKKICYRELNGLVNRFARALEALGVKKGDTVAVMLPNIPQAVIANYAVFRIGAVAAQNNPLYTERELTYQLADSDAKALVTLDLLLPRAKKIQSETKIETIITCHINDYLPFPKKQLFPYVKKGMYRKVVRQPGVFQFMDLLAQYPGDPMPDKAGWDDVGALLYTGGTTGVSKGVMLTHANMSCNVQQLRWWFPDLKEGCESMMGVFPFFHSAGFTGIQNLCMATASTIVLVPRPEPGIIIELLKKFKPCYLPGVPTIFVALLNDKRFTSMDLTFIKGFIAGAAPLSVETIRELKRLTGGDIINVYGLTEITPMGTASPWKGTIKPGTVGIPLPNTDLKIVDLDDPTKELKQGEAGEILFKGPQVMKGYYKKPEETAAVLRDGWLHTGDIGFLDEDGYLTIVDRKKDMIVASGFNIFPQEVDEVLMEHPRILEACTIGVPDSYRGEAPKSYVVLKDGGTLSAEEIVEFCKKRLAPYKVPRQIEFIDELPKTPVGKILRREVKELDRKKREAGEAKSV